MFSNIPTFLQQQDFNSSHWDMVASARCEPLTKEQIEDNKKYAKISMRMITEYNPSGDSYINWNDVFKPIPIDWDALMPNVYSK